jgi:putative cell wall-binding protein
MEKVNGIESLNSLTYFVKMKVFIEMKFKLKIALFAVWKWSQIKLMKTKTCHNKILILKLKSWLKFLIIKSAKRVATSKNLEIYDY